MDAKICGIKDSKTLKYIVNHNNPPRFIGFITNYPKSKRYVEYKDLKKFIYLSLNILHFDKTRFFEMMTLFLKSLLRDQSLDMPF